MLNLYILGVPQFYWHLHPSQVETSARSLKKADSNLNLPATKLSTSRFSASSLPASTTAVVYVSASGSKLRHMNIQLIASVILPSVLATSDLTLSIGKTTAPISLKVFRTVRTWHLGGHSICISVEQRECCASDDKRNLNEAHREFCKQ